MPKNTGREIEFTTGGIGPDVVMQNLWGWPQIQQLLGEVFLSSDVGNTTVSNREWQKMALQVYGFLPQGKEELRRIRDNGKRYFRDAAWGRPEAREILRPYRQQLRALVWATRMKLAAVHCRPDQQSWHKRAYGFFLALQNNLGRLRHLHFVTLTFVDPVDYGGVRGCLRELKKNILRREGLAAVNVIACHPSKGTQGRLHLHMLIWSNETRTPQAESAAVKRAFGKLSKCRRRGKERRNQSGYGVGRIEIERISGSQSFLRVFAYIAWNYSATLKLSKGDHNPVPPFARLPGHPPEVHPGVRWIKTGGFSFVTPATCAWRSAIGRYAAAEGRSTEGNWQWIWRERRRIREYLEPERWRPPSVTGLDGFTYRVIAYGEDIAGNETYLVSSEERGGFVLTEHGVEGVGKFETLCGALPQNRLLDLTTGEHACWFEIWGLPFPVWGNRRTPRRNRFRSGATR